MKWQAFLIFPQLTIVCNQEKYHLHHCQVILGSHFMHFNLGSKNDTYVKREGNLKLWAKYVAMQFLVPQQFGTWQPPNPVSTHRVSPCFFHHLWIRKSSGPAVNILGSSLIEGSFDSFTLGAWGDLVLDSLIYGSFDVIGLCLLIVHSKLSSPRNKWPT